MRSLDPIVFGLILVAIAVVLIGIIAIITRAFPKSMLARQKSISFPQINIDIPSSNDAVLLVQTGGRVIYANEKAYELFGKTEEPNLERLARRARPSDLFLGLCGKEGQARFSLDGRFIEGTSYYLPPSNGAGGAFLVSLRQPQVAAIASGEAELSNQALDIFAELSQQMASSLELETALHAIMESVERLIPSDFPEVTIWDSDNQNLIPYHFVGTPGIDQHLERSDERYTAEKGYSGYLITNRQPLLVEDVNTYLEVRPQVNQNQYPFNSYLGVPLLAAGELIGTLELASLNKGAFNQSDLDLLRVLSGQAAVAIHNAILFQDEQRRMLELSGLAKLAQAAGALQDTQDFYALLVDSITPLLDVEIIGFLIYDEARRRLVAQSPFKGLPSNVVDLYRVTISTGTPAEEVWLKQEMIIANPAPEDDRLKAYEIAHIALAAGIQTTIFVPLTSAGRMLGYLQVGDKRDGSQFLEADLRILTIIAGQAANVIQNATLVKESRERAQRSESMRRIASLTGSVATLDEILDFSVRELAQLLRADIAALFLVDENRAELSLHKESFFGTDSDLPMSLSRLSMNEPDFHFSVTSSQQSFFSDDLNSEEKLFPFYQQLYQALEVKSAIDVPIVIRDRGIGEILLASKKIEFFNRSDLILLSTTASQLAAAIEKSTLYTQTDESLRRRVDQLLALTHISRELNTNLELRSLIKLIFDELLYTTQASCGTISLFELSGSSQDQRTRLLFVGDSPSEEQSPLERQVLELEEAIIVNDFSERISTLGNIYLEPPHQGVVSAMVVPIFYQETIAGLIQVHSQVIGQFDKTALEIAQSLATQAAIALGNSMRFYEQKQRNELLSRRVETIEKLIDTSGTLSPEQPLEAAMEAVAYGLQESTPFNVVLVSIYNPQDQCLLHIAGAGLPIEAMQKYQEQPQSWTDFEPMLLPEYRFSRSYFIPVERDKGVIAELQTSKIVPLETSLPAEAIQWHAGDLLLLPMLDGDDRPLGLIKLDSPRNGLRPDKPTIETLEVFASQAALVIESQRMLAELSSRAKMVALELERARDALNTSQVYLPNLLHKDLENTITVQRLSQRSRRIQAGLDISEIINRQTNRSDILLVFSREFLNRIDMSIVLVGETLMGDPHLLHVVGTTPSSGMNLEALLGQKNPLRNALQSGEQILVANLDDNTDWKGTSLLQALEAKAFVCLPIIVDSKVDSAILVINQAPMTSFTPDDQHLFELMCRQVAIALENLRLLTETNRSLQEVNLLLEFNRQIGTMEPLGILRALIDSALKVSPSAHAGMVAIWKPEQGCLVPQVASGYINNSRMLEITYRPGKALPSKVFDSGEPIRLDEVNFAHDYNLSSESLLIYRDATEGRLPISSLVLPIKTGENKLGVLILDNFTSSEAFTQEDQDLVASLARQTALTLENARLYQASEQRAAQLLALTNVAATITSSLQTHELIDSLMDQVRTFITYDTGTLWLRQGNKLTIRAASGFEDSEQRIGLSVAIEDSSLLNEMIGTSQPISVKDVRDDLRFPSLIEHRYLSWLGVPLLSKGEVVGVIALEKAEPNFYTQEHISAMITFAGQVAVALVNASLYEESVRHAGELDERSKRLSLLNRLSTELSGSLDLDYILGVALRELLQAVQCKGVSALLFDTNFHPIIHAESPIIEENYPIQLPESLIFERIQESHGIFSTEEASQEEILDKLQDFLVKRSIHALLLLPLITGNELIGLLITYSDQSTRFDTDEVELARTITNQAAVAIQNARLFAETERLFGETQLRSAELGMLFEMGVNITQVLDQTKLIDAVFEKAVGMMQADSAGLVVMEGTENLIIRALEGQQRIGPTAISRNGTTFSEYVLNTGAPLLIKDLERERESIPVKGYVVGQEDKSWLGVPLVVRGATIGVLSVHSFRANAFGEPQLRLLGQLGNQLAVAMDNARLFETVQNSAADLAQRVSDRTKELEAEHIRIETLLTIITELSASLDLDVVLNRTLAVLNEAINAEHSLIMLYQSEESSLRLRASLGYTTPPPKGGQPSAIKPSEGLAGWVLTNRKSAFISDLLEDERWIKRPDATIQHRSAMAVPLLIGEESLGVLMLYHRQPNRFNKSQLELVEATARQIAVAINNAQLYNLIRDQAERLGDMLRTQHIETSRSQAMLEAVADGVLVTDSKRVITLFNASAEKILGLKREQLLGHSMEKFMGLFGKAAHSWVQTIRTWSEDPDAFKPGETYAEQIELDDRRVVSVHLSPVQLRNDFLGTVSIFRDITHLIELDRLKSEFVATVSHELRTPMTSIKGYVEILLMGAAGNLTEQQTHFLQVVRTNTERLSVLVNDLLDISRIESGRSALSFQPLDVYKIVQFSMDTIRQRMRDEERPMQIKVDMPDNLPAGYGDQERIQQILDNLVENSYQYTPENGEIQIRVRKVKKELQFDVKDNGIGIIPEDESRVFERFYRGEDPLVLATSGTGLGLSIVQHLVEMHHGRIWFESQGVPGLGSTFSFTIPIYNPDVVEGS